MPRRRRDFNEMYRLRITGCWEWLGSMTPGGYGRHRSGQPAHRVSYELHVGPIPKGLQLDHLCRNRWCVNPEHLEPVTMAENLRRGKEALGIGEYRTHCVLGHEYTPDNTYTPPGTTRRFCRTCNSQEVRRWKAQNPEEWAKLRSKVGRPTPQRYARGGVYDE